MTLSTDLSLLELGLDALEEIEVRCLVWGLVDANLSHDEVRQALRATLQSPKGQALALQDDCTISDAAELRDRLVEHGCLFPALDHQGRQTGWRTRMAEGVRLLAQLRQMFPRHKDGGWTNAATLVADYRLVRRPRRYPKRDVSPDTAKVELAQGIQDEQLIGAINHWLDALKSGSGLARFQLDATTRILQSLENGQRTGTLVSAGTGSGKTLAFYLPALAWLATQRAKDTHATGTRVLALYPRNELLKDQLSAVYKQCRSFDSWIGKRHGKSLRIGVLYGETPRKLYPEQRYQGWERNNAGGYSVCPFFRCPHCSEELRVRDEDVLAGKPGLTCKSGSHWIDDSTLAFTRDAIAANPPDLLFTSVEMLNRHLPSVDLRHVFGVGPRAARAPDLVLMDEVHLYSGTYGAQVAYLMRRWWAATRRKSCFVGLSATLSNGRSFFANLTGLNEASVQEVRPGEQDLVQEGAEYMVALRGDPVSQSALLSTTIQTLMLGTRLLDRRANFDKHTWPFYGWRSFAFTDQLDAANRLYRDLLDAEGRYPDSGRVNTFKPTLATLREPTEPPGRRYLHGQDWRSPQDIGHALQDKLSITRTTSYDSGVSAESEVVIATAALEVGFDDEAVGLVLQHKAPRDMASFLQRKGRAGRTRHTRPWTVVVLSDYGRDRMAYQAYEQLFDPELPARQLPLSNRYVQRMQAVYALLDEIGDRMEGSPFTGRVWSVLRGPAQLPVRSGWPSTPPAGIRQLVNGSLPKTAQALADLKREANQFAPSNCSFKWAGANWLATRLEQRRILEILSACIADSAAIEQISRRLADRLSMKTEAMIPLMWEHPRPIILGAIPTTQRRLSSNWRSHEQPEADFSASHPLPDFVPANLFDDLSLPELRLNLPDSAPPELQDEYMRVQQALTEFAPGKVSRRFSSAYWLGFDSATLLEIWDQPEGEPIHRQQDLANWYALDAPRAVHLQAADQLIEMKGFNPRAAHLKDAEDFGSDIRVGDTSNAQIRWCTQLLRPHGGDQLKPPTHVGICALIEEVQAHTHARQNPAVARRYAYASKAELKLTQGQESRRFIVQTRFTHENSPACVGFDIDVDALVIVLRIPENLSASIEWTPEASRAARAARYNYETQQGEVFTRVVPNVFLRNWIAQVFQTAAVMHTESSGSLRASLDALASGVHSDLLLNVLSRVFQSPEHEEAPDRLRHTLADLLRSETVLQTVRGAARVLVDPISEEWNSWLSLAVRTTLGAAFLQGIQEACPQIDTDALVVDVEPGLLSGGEVRAHKEIWISESNPGGNGLIEQIVEMLASQPDLLFKHVETAMGPQDLEFSTLQLRQVAKWIGDDQPDNELVDAVRRVRHSSDIQTMQRHFGELRSLLIQRGQSLFHGYAVSLSMRFLRPNSPQRLDHLIEEVCRKWEEMEAKIGVEVDVRVICALYSDDGRFDLAFAETGMSPPDHDREAWRLNLLASVLWSRGHALRAVALPLYNRFANTNIATERLLLSQWITKRQAPIDPRVDGWLASAHESLRSRQSVTLRLPAQEAQMHLPKVTQAMVTEPIQFEYLNLYARLTEVKRSGADIEWTFAIPDPL